jgi:hypothetical protein
MGREIQARVAEILMRSVGLSPVRLERRESDRGSREVWDFELTAPDDATHFLGSWDLPSGNRLDAFRSRCRCEERFGTNLAVGLTWSYAPTAMKSYTARREIVHEVLARLSSDLGRPPSHPRVEPHKQNPRMLVFGWSEA